MASEKGQRILYGQIGAAAGLSPDRPAAQSDSHPLSHAAGALVEGRGAGLAYAIQQV